MWVMAEMELVSQLSFYESTTRWHINATDVAHTIWSNPFATISYPLCQQCCRGTAPSQYIYMNVKPWVPILLQVDKSYVIIIRDVIQRWQDINCTAHFQKCPSLLALRFFLTQNPESIDSKKKNTITRVRWVNCICRIWIFYLSC